MRDLSHCQMAFPAFSSQASSRGAQSPRSFHTSSYGPDPAHLLHKRPVFVCLTTAICWRASAWKVRPMFLFSSPCCKQTTAPGLAITGSPATLQCCGDGQCGVSNR